nr:polysaccharide biosynthesis protein [Bacillus tequilensis]
MKSVGIAFHAAALKQVPTCEETNLIAGRMW